jgi:hypothetical protein
MELEERIPPRWFFSRYMVSKQAQKPKLLSVTNH